MARTRIDLNRFKKIYPLQRKSPVWFTNQGGDSVEAVSGTCISGQYQFQTTGIYNSPIVVATAEDNVNVWVASISPVGDGTFTIVIQTSDNTYTGDVHVHIGEANVP